MYKAKMKAYKDFKINVRGKRADTPPMVYTDIEVEYLLWSDDLNVRDVEQAISYQNKNIVR